MNGARKPIGKCSLCGGTVSMPEAWMSVDPPVPTCEKCGAVADEGAMLPTVPMKPRQGWVTNVGIMTFHFALALLLLAAPAWGGPPDGAALALELARFPPPCVAEVYAELARDHWKWVGANAPLNADRAFWHDYQRQAASRAAAWRHLYWAHRSTTASRRWYSLDLLSQVLGDELYAAGWMPAPMPAMDDIWR